MNNLEALIFDVDGTLADTERDGHRIAFNLAFKEFDLDWNWDIDLYGKLLAVTGGKERMNYYLDNFNTDFQKTDTTQNLIKELHQAKTRHYTELLATGTIPLRPGVRRLIKEALENNLRIAVATTTTPENVTALLEHALEPGSVDWFDVIAAGDIVPAKKPAPDIYTYALKQMNLPASACLAFEDSENGILSSTGADLKTLITINDYTKDHDFTGAAIVLSDLGEPDSSFTTIAGDNHGFNFVNVAMLKAIHQN